jgi:hypothetical protein
MLKFVRGEHERLTLNYVLVLFCYCCDKMLCLYISGPVTSPFSIPQTIYEFIRSSGGIILTRENPKYRRKACLSFTVSTTNPTWTHLSSNPYFRCQKRAPNCLSYSTTLDEVHSEYYNNTLIEIACFI